MQRVINFSGGKTSAYMTIQEYREGDIVLFCDTGREHPKTYKFINDFEAHEGIPVTRIRYVINENGKATATADPVKDGEVSAFEAMLVKKKYLALPRRVRRFCTSHLKVDTARRYMVSIGCKKYTQMIGFRYDEPQRVKRFDFRLKSVQILFPLYEQQVTKAMINDYWQSKPYNLEIQSILGNCTLCFMKGKNAIAAILREFPELADEWIQDEDRARLKTGRSDMSFVEGTTIRQLRTLAQNNLFTGYDLGEIKPAFDCACTA